MQDAMYEDELLSQLSYLRYKEIIPDEIVHYIMTAISKGDFGKATLMLDEILSKNNIDKNSIKNFTDNIKTDPYGRQNYSECMNDEKNVHEHTNPKKNYSNEFLLFQNELNEYQREIKRLRTLYNDEKNKHKNITAEFIEINKQHQVLKSKYEKMTSELQQKRIEDKIPDYVSDVSKKLEDDDTLFMKKSQRWSRTGIILSFLAASIALYTFNKGIQQLSPSQNIGYVTLIFVFFRGFLAIGILSWVAYLCFNMASSYIHESILRKDRQHALSFGRLFLQIYGDTATKDDAIEVFKDWNRSGDSAFSKKNSAPPNIMKLAELFKKTGSSDEK